MSSRQLFLYAVSLWVVHTYASLKAQVRPNLTPPVIRFAEASPLRLPGLGVDSNSPSHWDNGTLYLFTSWFEPVIQAVRSEGKNLFAMGQPFPVSITNAAGLNGGRWLEATYKSEDGTLYGWYHNEPGGVCPGSGLTAPRIGAMKSFDNGANWIDLGIVLEPAPGTNHCEAQNGYFAGGYGDFSVILDHNREYFYFLFSSYVADPQEQGVAVARMPYSDRDLPAGKVWKWHQGSWQELGIGGHLTPVFLATRSWAYSDPDSFWGPSVHFNTYLLAYAVLLNRTANGNKNWASEGIYISYNKDLASPESWTLPEKILDGGDWYPQVIGTDSEKQETDKLGGRVVRFFLKGYSQWEISFLRRPEILAAGSGCPDRYCIWILGNSFAPDCYVDIRRRDQWDIIATYRGNDLRHSESGQADLITFRLSDGDPLRTVFETEGLRIRVVNPRDGTWSESALVKRGD